MNPIKITFGRVSPDYALNSNTAILSKPATAEVPYKERKATYSGVSHSVSRCCEFNASTRKTTLTSLPSGSTSRHTAGVGKACRAVPPRRRLRGDTPRLRLVRAPATEAISGTC